MTSRRRAPASLRDHLSFQCPELPEDVLTDFLTRMDPEYFTAFAPEIVAQHVRLAALLSLDNLCELSVRPLDQGRFEITVVAYDYFSEFAAICGLLSACGLNIDEGRIYTFSEADTGGPVSRQPYGQTRRRPKSRPGLTRKKIVDMFSVRPVDAAVFEPTQQRQLANELKAVLRLLDDNRFGEARQYVNRRLVEELSKHRSAFSGLLHPVQIQFDNAASSTDTLMEIRSDDTPAFLYAFANALAMRNIYISKAEFANDRGKLHDRFYVRNRHGQKVLDQAEQQELRLAAVLIKQFTHALTWAPDPAKALDSFDQFLDMIMEESRHSSRPSILRFVQDKKSLPVLARLLGASDFLWEDFLRRQHGNVLPLLQDYRHAPLIKPKATLRQELDRLLARARGDEARKEALNRFKDRELFRIDMTHLLDHTGGLSDFSLALTELAETIMARSLKDCMAKLQPVYGTPKLHDDKPCSFAVLGMGKFGGRELGYASDIEVLFVYGGSGRTTGKPSIDNSEYFERLAQELLGWIAAKQEGIFHLDVRLRPHGGKGALTNSLDEIRHYYSDTGSAAPFERQALIKLRSVAGDEWLGLEVERHRDQFVYSGRPWDLATALDLRRQQIRQFVEPGHINVKYSPGGVIDVEYAVQYLQLMHGHHHPDLRTPNTLQALHGLVKCGFISEPEGKQLRQAYLFIRMLIDGLRMVRGHAKDLVVPATDSDEFIFLARRVGYTTDDWQTGAKHLQTDIDRHMTATREFFERKFGRL